MKIPKNPVVYVTKNKERAEGLIENDMYKIVTGDGTKDTLELLSLPETARVIEENKASVLVFKNNQQIENICKSNGWHLLNPSAELAEKVENKITQVTWLDDLTSLLPPHNITKVKNIPDTIFSTPTSHIIQWAHSHTGEGTLHITNTSELTILKNKFPEREARLTEYIKGPMFTVNIVISKKNILIGNISYQITGISPFTEHAFSTIGNDWSLPFNILKEKNLEEFNIIADQVAKKLQKEGWRGLCGIDVIYDEERDKLFLIEINARQPASTTYESKLQESMRNKGLSGLTTFEAHLIALTEDEVKTPLIPINDGAQIIQRITSKITERDPLPLRTAGYNVQVYNNKKLNSDLLRIQSKLGIMDTHNKFNKRGKEIQDMLS